MLQKSTIQLLRFHFSFFLLPVYLFALSQTQAINWTDAIIVFIVLHVLVYPSSNGYNSYMDRDTTPIGGLANPLQPTKQLFWLTVIMDITAVAISSTVSFYFAAGVLIYILASRVYSYRGIRLKRFPVLGYLVVVVCQGALVFFLAYHGSSMNKTFDVPLLPLIAAACLIGGYYPLTQVYQHDEDLKDGVKTISWLLGKRGTFIFCSFVFAAATLFMFLTFRQTNDLLFFWLFLICMGPMIMFFTRWMLRVWKDEKAASFSYSLTMNILAAVCSTICYGIILMLKLF